MKITCKFMELGKPLFLAGTNYSEKLNQNSGKGRLELIFDTDARRAEITDSRGFRTFVTESWVFCYEPMQEMPAQKANVSHAQHVGVPAKAQIGGPKDVFTAQVETPIDKVQGKPGRKAKFQGQEGPAE